MSHMHFCFGTLANPPIPVPNFQSNIFFSVDWLLLQFLLQYIGSESIHLLAFIGIRLETFPRLYPKRVRGHWGCNDLYTPCGGSKKGARPPPVPGPVPFQRRCHWSIRYLGAGLLETEHLDWAYLIEVQQVSPVCFGIWVVGIA